MVPNCDLGACRLITLAGGWEPPPPPPREKKRKSSEAKSGSIHPYGRYGDAVKTRKAISTIVILWPVKAIVEKRAATVEVDSFVSLVRGKKPCTTVLQ